MFSGVALALTVAVVVTVESAIATDGTMATLPPAAPVFACTASPCSVFAASVTSPPPFSVPPRSAVVVSSTIASATDAPMPTELALVVESLGKALASDAAFEVAVIATAPVPAVSVPAMSAVVAMFSMSIASEPATLTDPPPAPLVAAAPSSCSEFISASIVAPFEVTVAPAGRIASFAIFA